MSVYRVVTLARSMGQVDLIRVVCEGEYLGVRHFLDGVKWCARQGSGFVPWVRLECLTDSGEWRILSVPHGWQGKPREEGGMILRDYLKVGDFAYEEVEE